MVPLPAIPTQSLRALVLALLSACAMTPERPEVSHPGPELAESLSVLAPFCGPEWTATFPNGLTDTQRFAPMVDGHFLRNTHEVRTADGSVVYEGETIYAADPESGQIRWWYFNSTGGWLDGTLQRMPDGELRAEGRNHAGEGQVGEVRSSMRLHGPGAYSSATWFLRDGEWHVEGELEYVRE